MNYFSSKNRYRKKTQEGYILLLSLLVISVLLSIGFGIYTISVKEVVLSSFLRDSAKALAAADRGVECALYWDRSTGGGLNGLSYTMFATSSTYVPPANAGNAVCHNGTANLQLNSVSDTDWDVTSTATDGTTNFSLDFSDGTCVDVTVTKTGNDSTLIIGDGYNTCNVDVLRRTQREIAVSTNF